ncbi:MAG TPA: hypothetical protein VFF06_31205 [Polyangia bacterium]|nr:hypothetical protein [Polyangia bacterium]
MPTDFDEDWISASADANHDIDAFEDEDTLEFVITSADEEDESTWQWDGHEWRRV